jgi:hypothetical protein
MIEQGTATEVRGPDPARPPFTAIARAHVRAGDHEEVVEVGPFPTGGSTGGDGVTKTMLLHRLRDDAILVVTPAVARRLVPRATTTRPRTLLGDGRRVQRVLLHCGVAQELVDEGSGLKLVEPKGYETDGSIVQLVDGLVRGKVLAWVSDVDDGSFGLDSHPGDACRVVLFFADGGEPARIRFGAEGEGGVYGTVGNRPEVFVAPVVLRELAARIYVSHAALRVDPAAVEHVTVTQHGKQVTARDATALREAAGALYADHAVSIGGTNVGPVDVEIAIALAEGGPPKRVACGAEMSSATGRWRRCAADDVKAVFEVRPALVNAFVASPPDASARHSQ